MAEFCQQKKEENFAKICDGSFAIVRKVGGEHMRLCRLSAGQRVLIERLSLDPKEAIGASYGMFEVDSASKHLRPVDPTSTQFSSVNGSENFEQESGNESGQQHFTSDQILALKDGGIGTSDLVHKLVNANNFFPNRTKFSKEKYVRKKACKHSDRIIISKPNIRLLTECYYRKDPERLGHLRIDQLGLLLHLSGVHSGQCNVFVFEQMLGLVGAAVLERLSSGNGSCTFLHRGDWPQSIPCLEAIEFSEKQMNAFLPLRITTLLGKEIDERMKMERNIEKTPTKPEEVNVSSSLESREERQLMDTTTEAQSAQQASQEAQERKKLERAQKERRAMELIFPSSAGDPREEEGKLDTICVACRCADPVDILQRVYPGLRLSGTIVVYSPIKQHLLNVWEWLRSTGSAVDIQLSQQFYRSHQVLPNRTHPVMQQSVSGGYILYATKVLVPASNQLQQRSANKELLSKVAKIDELQKLQED